MKYPEKLKVSMEVYTLRAKSAGYSAIQYTGWLVLFYAIHQLAKPFLSALGYDISLPEVLTAVAPALTFADALGAMFAGMIIVWISTASWF
jgi:hypothetical protein